MSAPCATCHYWRTGQLHPEGGPLCWNLRSPRWGEHTASGDGCEQHTVLPRPAAQPIYRDTGGVVRFRANAIVRFLLDYATAKGVSLNELALMPFSDEDRRQFAQLIGYSVSGYGDLPYVDDAAYEAAERAVKALGEAK